MQYFYLWILVLTMIMPPTMAVLHLPPNVTVPALFGFGDSVIDAGNNNDNHGTIARSNFPPYGKDFTGGMPTGRFSNGRVPTDLIAEQVSIKKYVPAYLDPNLGPDDLLTGVTFASGGSGYDPLSSRIARVIDLSQQLELFKEYIGKIQKLVGEERTEFIISNSLYLVVTASNDIASNYFSLPLRKTQYSVDSYATFLVNSASSFVEELYNLGARRIVMFEAPPIGCMPWPRTFNGGFQRDCEENMNHLAQVFNSKLSTEIDSVKLKLPNSRIAIIKIYDPLMDYIQNPMKYGFEQSLRGCCGTGLYEVSIYCNRLDTVCQDDSKYLFWDGYHPSEKGYTLLVNSLLPQYVSSLF